MVKEGTAASASATSLEGDWNARMLNQFRTSINLDSLIITPSRSHSLFQTPSATISLHARIYRIVRRNIQENIKKDRKEKGYIAGAGAAIWKENTTDINLMPPPPTTINNSRGPSHRILILRSTLCPSIFTSTIPCLLLPFVGLRAPLSIPIRPRVRTLFQRCALPLLSLDKDHGRTLRLVLRSQIALLLWLL